MAQLLPPIWEEEVWIQPVTLPYPAPPDTHLGDVLWVPIPPTWDVLDALLWVPIFQLPWKGILAAGKSFRKDWGMKEYTGKLPASATPRSCALGEKGQGAWTGVFNSGVEVEQVLGECGRTWEIKPENCCREPEILWSARDRATSQEWNHGLSNDFVPPIESCGEQMWKGGLSLEFSHLAAQAGSPAKELRGEWFMRTQLNG